MYDYLRRLYLAGSLSDAGLQNAVTKGWITQAQADQIRADKAAQDGTTTVTALAATATKQPEHDHKTNRTEEAEVLEVVVLTMLEG